MRNRFSKIKKGKKNAAPSDRLSGVPIIAEARIGKHCGEMRKIKYENTPAIRCESVRHCLASHLG